MTVKQIRAIADLVQREATSDDQIVSVMEMGSEGTVVIFRIENNPKEWDRFMVSRDGYVDLVNHVRYNPTTDRYESQDAEGQWKN